jgi:hypothetical protein
LIGNSLLESAPCMRGAIMASGDRRRSAVELLIERLVPFEQRPTARPIVQSREIHRGAALLDTLPISFIEFSCLREKHIKELLSHSRVPQHSEASRRSAHSNARPLVAPIPREEDRFPAQGVAPAGTMTALGGSIETLAPFLNLPKSAGHRFVDFPHFFGLESQSHGGAIFENLEQWQASLAANSNWAHHWQSHFSKNFFPAGALRRCASLISSHFEQPSLASVQSPWCRDVARHPKDAIKNSIERLSDGVRIVATTFFQKS